MTSRVPTASLPMLSTAEVAERAGLHPRDVPRWFRSRGVTPRICLGVSPTGQRVHLFRWRDLARAIDGVSPDPWVRRELNHQPSWTDPVDLDLDGELCHRALAKLSPRHAYAVVATLVNESTFEELGGELGVSRERARKIAERGTRAFRVAFAETVRPRPPTPATPPTPIGSPEPRTRAATKPAPFVPLDRSVGVPLAVLLASPRHLERRRGTVFAWHPSPWRPNTPAIVMHRANLNAARGLYAIGDYEAVYAAAQGTDTTEATHASAHERVERVNAAFGSGPTPAPTDAWSARKRVSARRASCEPSQAGPNAES